MDGLGGSESVSLDFEFKSGVEDMGDAVNTIVA